MALGADGVIYSWGANIGAQLGTSAQPSPQPVTRINMPAGVIFTAFSTGGIGDGRGHTLARASDGTVWAWGHNGNGQLGDGHTIDTSTPTRVGGLTGVTTVAAGAFHSLAVLAGGQVKAWGANGSGQLGIGTMIDSATPANSQTLAEGVFAGSDANHSLAGPPLAPPAPPIITGPVSNNFIHRAPDLRPEGYGDVTFSGEINGYGGQYWWFEYGQVGSNKIEYAPGCPPIPYTCPTPPSPQPIPASGVVSSRVPWQAETIDPWHLYWYRLVVGEDLGPGAFGPPHQKYGSTRYFLPGDELNPPNFDPTTSGDLKYNFVIDCSNHCRNVDPGFGLEPPEMMRSSTLRGSLKIDSFDPNTGKFRGSLTGWDGTYSNVSLGHVQVCEISGRLLCRIEEFRTIGPGVLFLQSAHTYEYDNVQGRLGAGQAYIMLGRVKGCEGSPAYHCGHLQTPTLVGAITYGRLSGLKKYNPVFGGNIGGGGTWSACYESKGCAGPSVPDKETVKSLAEGTGAIGVPVGFIPVVGAPAGAALGIASIVLSAIAADPPDHRYRRRTHLPHVPAIEVKARGGLNQATANALSAVATALARTAASGDAFLEALQRYRGAVRAADPRWVAYQWLGTLRYGNQFVAETRRAARVISAERKLLARSGLVRRRLSHAALTRIVRSIRRHGLPKSVVAQLRLWGFPPGTIRAARRFASVKRAPGTLLGAVLRPRFVQDLRKVGVDIGRYLANLKRAPIA
jgi:hypothetical protein